MYALRRTGSCSGELWMNWRCGGATRAGGNGIRNTTLFICAGELKGVSVNACLDRPSLTVGFCAPTAHNRIRAHRTRVMETNQQPGTATGDRGIPRHSARDGAGRLFGPEYLMSRMVKPSRRTRQVSRTPSRAVPSTKAHRGSAPRALHAFARSSPSVLRLARTRGCDHRRAL